LIDQCTLLGTDRRVTMVEVVGFARGSRILPDLFRLVFAGQPAAVQRRPHQRADVVSPAPWQHIVIDGAHEHGVRRLLAARHAPLVPLGG